MLLESSNEMKNKVIANKPLISVIVLCYKNRHLLNGMLNSILNQTYSNIQLIVSDDGSDDFDVEEVREYILNNAKYNVKDVIVRKNPQNLKTVKHFHSILPLADGEYIIFTAADDRFQNEGVLEKYAELFAQNNDKLWLVASCNFLTPDYKKSVYISPTEMDRPFFVEGDSSKLFSRWSRRGMAVPCSMAFRKKAFDVVGGIDLDYVYLEDWPLVLKLLRSGNAPIYMREIAALHSVGGVTNSNQRYGVEVRKKFFDDKELVYQKEVKPYLNLLTKEDLNLLKCYRKEINARNYFLQINWQVASSYKKTFYLFNPTYLLWLLEAAFNRYEKYLRKPIMLVISQFCLLASALLLGIETSSDYLNMVFNTFGYLHFTVSIILLLIVLFLIPFCRYVYSKRALRKMLVN